MTEASNAAASPERFVLENPWRRFATLDLNSYATQMRFFRLRVLILVVGVAATMLAIVYS